MFRRRIGANARRRPGRFALTLALSLWATSLAFAQDAAELMRQANAAYDRKDFAASASLFVDALEAGAGTVTGHYNAACAFALAGDKDQAFVHLRAAIDAGLDGSTSPAADADLASLHDDPRWPPLLAAFEAAHPDLPIRALVQDSRRPATPRYFAARQALKDGVVSAADTGSMFNQYYANLAQFVGEYDEASRIYGGPRAVDDPPALGFNQAVAARPLILARTNGRRAVFLNESHGQSQTRAAVYALLAPLRAQGFSVLALETLATADKMSSGTERCASVGLDDAALPERGYAVLESGYYTRDPLFAEIVREAIRLGYRLVAYDSPVAGGVPAREQNQAENLACVFKDDPEARLVVLAGFSHIAEGKDFWVPGGAMAYRFKQLTGIDPLTVDTTTELGLDESKLRFDPATADPMPAFALVNAAGVAYGSDNFDLAVYVPAPAHRNEGDRSWLALGGAREPVEVSGEICGGLRPCLIDARREGEVPEAVASDRCVLDEGMGGCRLFLAPGKYRIAGKDADETTIADETRLVR